MRQHANQPGHDRWAAPNHGIVILDGATAFDPQAPAADDFVDVLLAALTDTLDAPAHS